MSLESEPRKTARKQSHFADLFFLMTGDSASLRTKYLMTKNTAFDKIITLKATVLVFVRSFPFQQRWNKCQCSDTRGSADLLRLDYTGTRAAAQQAFPFNSHRNLTRCCWLGARSPGPREITALQIVRRRDTFTLKFYKGEVVPPSEGSASSSGSPIRPPLRSSSILCLRTSGARNTRNLVETKGQSCRNVHPCASQMKSVNGSIVTKALTEMNPNLGVHLHI